MSIIYDIQNCPLCKQAVGFGDEANRAPNYELNCRSFEYFFDCGSPECRFRSSAEIKEQNGSRFWVETAWYPMNERGQVLRPQKPKTADNSKKSEGEWGAEWQALVERQENEDIEAEATIEKQEQDEEGAA